MAHFCTLLLSIFLTGHPPNDLEPFCDPVAPREPQECIPPTAREERELFSQINTESRRLYNALDCHGKRKALELASTYPNKNQAVQNAAKDMAHRRAVMYRNQKRYSEQLKEESNQSEYDDQYGN